MAPRRDLMFLLLLFVITSSCLADSQQHNKDVGLSKRRHSRHYHSKNTHRYSSKFSKENRFVNDKNVEKRQQKTGSLRENYDKHMNDQQEVFHKVQEPEVERRVEYPWQTYISPSCLQSPSCNIDSEISKMIRIMQIKEQILRETGLKAPPNMTGVVISFNPVLQKLISNLNKENEEVKPKNESQLMNSYGDDPNIKRKQVFVPATKGPEFVRIPMGKLHYFNLSSEHSSSIEQAILHIYLKPISEFTPKDKFAQISFYKVEPPKFFQDYNRLRSIPSMNSKITVPYSMSGSWEKIDVFSLVREWVSNQSMNLGFVINISVDGINLDIDTADEDPSHAPMLELDVKEEKYDRQKRHTGNRLCSEEKKEKECCRYPLIVDFMEYQYDFIVAPKKYKANYCQGECPFLYAHKVPHTTLLQQKFNDTSKFRHGPCCGASNLAPLTMVYYDGEKIKIETIDDMVVVECSCK